MTLTSTTPPDSGPQPADGQRRIGRKWLIFAAVALALILLVAVVLVAIAAGDGDPDGRADRADHVVTGPRDGATEATVELLTGASAVTVRAADVGDRLFEARTPDESRQVPLVSRSDGVVRVELGDSGEGGPSAVEIVLSPEVAWTVRLVAGATRHSVDLSAGRVTGVEFVGGAGSIDLALPRPSGTVEVRMTGGTGAWATHLPAGVPVRVLAGSGAGAVTIDAATRNGVAAGTTITGDGWDAATDRYDIVATGGMASFTVDRH
jgi:hypothetical protein